MAWGFYGGEEAADSEIVPWEVAVAQGGRPAWGHGLLTLLLSFQTWVVVVEAQRWLLTGRRDRGQRAEVHFPPLQEKPAAPLHGTRGRHEPVTALEPGRSLKATGTDGCGAGWSLAADSGQPLCRQHFLGPWAIPGKKFHSGSLHLRNSGIPQAWVQVLALLPRGRVARNLSGLQMRAMVPVLLGFRELGWWWLWVPQLFLCSTCASVWRPQLAVALQGGRM